MCEAHIALYVRYIRTHHYVLLSCTLPVHQDFRPARNRNINNHKNINSINNTMHMFYKGL